MACRYALPRSPAARQQQVRGPGEMASLDNRGEVFELAAFR